uniref:Uncharacterized protein n=1 Tax=Chenopodium quinoa TaxID=63459 RepID=A0A803N3V7_CHEQI
IRAKNEIETPIPKLLSSLPSFSSLAAARSSVLLSRRRRCFVLLPRLFAFLCSNLYLSGAWKNLELKEYNFKAKGLPLEGGHLHPLLKNWKKDPFILYGSGVKKSDLKNKDTKSNYILPEEFLVGIKTQLVQEIAPTITAAVLDSIREVNPGINLVVPSTLQQLTPHDASSAPNRNTAQSGQSSKSFNQVVDDDELPRDE